MREIAQRKREWTHGVAILFFALCLAAGPAWADGPVARCKAVVAGGRTLVDVELERFIDVRLAKLVKLGLEGRIHLELVLLRARPFWFDEAQDRTTADSVLRYDREGRVFSLGRDRQLEEPLKLSLERVSLRPPDGMEQGGRYRVEVKASLQVVTPQSLGKVASWLAGRSREGDDASELSQALVSAVAEDLARSLSCTCEAKPFDAAEAASP